MNNSRLLSEVKKSQADGQLTADLFEFVNKEIDNFAVIDLQMKAVITDKVVNHLLRLKFRSFDDVYEILKTLILVNRNHYIFTQIFKP